MLYVMHCIDLLTSLNERLNQLTECSLRQKELVSVAVCTIDRTQCYVEGIVVEV